MIFVMSRAQGFAVKGFLGSAIEMWVQVLPHSSASFANPPSLPHVSWHGSTKTEKGWNPTNI